MKRLILCCSTLLILASCEKEDNMLSECDQLKAGLMEREASAVQTSMSGLLNIYSEANLSELVAALNKSCDLQAVLLCYDCIYTLPSQSEIKVSFSAGGQSHQRIIDLSYTATNLMKVVAIHD